MIYKDISKKMIKRGAEMDIKQLQTFLTAADTLSFTQTAQRLDYAQSSITAQIKTLEQELGVMKKC